MSMYFWSFIAGVATLLLIQHLACIPSMRRHKVVMALLARAERYQNRAKVLAAAGKDEEALKLLAECKTLMAQAEELHQKNKR